MPWLHFSNLVVEFTAKPDKRGDLRRVLEEIIANHGAGTRGDLGSARFEVLDQLVAQMMSR